MDDLAESWMTLQDCLSRINQWPKIMTGFIGRFKDILYLFISPENLNSWTSLLNLSASWSINLWNSWSFFFLFQHRKISSIFYSKNVLYLQCYDNWNHGCFCESTLSFQGTTSLSWNIVNDKVLFPPLQFSEGTVLDNHNYDTSLYNSNLLAMIGELYFKPYRFSSDCLTMWCIFWIALPPLSFISLPVWFSTMPSFQI